MELLTHYQFPICPEWEESMTKRIKSYSYQTSDIIDFYTITGSSIEGANLENFIANKAIIFKTSTALIIDPDSMLFGSILYAVNRTKENMFWLLGRGVEETNVLEQYQKGDRQWEYPHTEYRIQPGIIHRNLAKKLYHQK